MLVLSTFIPQLNARTCLVTRQELIEDSDLIAIVLITDINSTNKKELMSDLKVDGFLVEVLKGDKSDLLKEGELLLPEVLKGKLKGNVKEIRFTISRDLFNQFPIDVSTGHNLVFLKKDKNKYMGFVDWDLTCIYLNADKVKWYDDKGDVGLEKTPQEIINEVKKLINKTTTNQ